MYDLIKNEKKFFIEELDYSYQQEVIPRPLQNIMSLQVAAEMSIKLLESTYKEDIPLLYFLGCLPGGIHKDKLPDMCKYKFDTIELSLSRFEELSLFEEYDSQKQKLLLTPTMIQHIEKSIDLSSKLDYMKIICEYYIELLIKSYQEIGKARNNKWSTTTIGELPSFSVTGSSSE